MHRVGETGFHKKKKPKDEEQKYYNTGATMKTYKEDQDNNTPHHGDL